MPQAPQIQNVVRCGAASVVLTAILFDANELRLYEAQMGGNLLSSDNTAPYQVTTPFTTTNTTYFVSSYNSLTGCESARIPVTLNIHRIPSLPNVSPVSRCGSGTAVLSASLDDGGDELVLYNEAIGGIVLGRSTIAPHFNITTPIINTTTTFYAAAVDSRSGCSSERVPVVVSVIPLPPVPSSQDRYQCGSGPANLEVFLEPGYRVHLYNHPSLNQPLTSTETYPYVVTSPFIETTTTLYISSQSLETGCESYRIPVVVKVIPKPSVPHVAEVSRCGIGSVTFSPSMSGGTATHLALYSTAAAPIPIASDNTPVYELTTPPITTTTTFYVAAIDEVSGCSSERASVRAVVKQQPLPPNVSVSPLCGSGSTTITATLPNSLGMQTRLFGSLNALFPLYSDVTPPFELPTPTITTLTTLYVESFDLETGCSSSRVPVVIEPQTPPAPPAISPSVTRCGPGNITFTVEMRNPVGDEVRVYENNQLLLKDDTWPFEFLVPDVSQSKTFSISVVNTLTGCESIRRTLSVTIVDIPPPLAPQEAFRCGSGVVTFTAELGNLRRLRLFANPNGGEPLGEDNLAPYALNTPIVTTHTTFYLEVVNTQTGCSSSRSVAVAKVRELPSPPVVNDVNICGNQVAQLTVTLSGATSTSAVRLYQTINTSDVLASATVPYVLVTPPNLTTTTYYVEHYDYEGHCASARVPVIVNVLPLPADPVVANVERCGAGIVTFSINISSGHKALLYADLTSNIPLSQVSAPPYLLSTPPVAGSTNFFIELISDATNCRSSRVRAMAIVKEKPLPPTIRNVERCGTGAVSFVATIVSGDKVYLYKEPVGGSPISTASVYPFTLVSPSVENTTTFYAAAALQALECESERVPVVVTVHPIPSAPIISSVSRCGPGAVLLSDITVLSPATELRIYSTPQTNIITASSFVSPHRIEFDNVSTTTTYYASLYNPNTGCESERARFVIQINPILDAPTASDARRCGNGSVQFSVSLPELANETLQLFDGEQGGTPLDIATRAPYLLNTPSISQTQDFYIARVSSITGCSSTRTKVRAIVYTPPAPASAESARRCGSGSATFTVRMAIPAGTQVRLFTTAVGGNVFAASEGPEFLINSPVVTTNTTFYLEVLDAATQCTSSRSAVSLEILETPQPPLVQNVVRCGGGSVTFTVIGFSSGVRLYTVSTGGSSIAEAYGSPAEIVVPNVTFTTTYYFEAVSEICPSNVRSTAVALIQPLPGKPTAANVAVCGSAPATISASMGSPLGEVISIYQVPQGGTAISSAITSPFLLTLPIVTTTTTFYIESSIPAYGCASERMPVVVRVEPVPLAPLVKNAHRCGAGITTFLPLVGIGNTVRMYSSLASQAALLGEDDAQPYELHTPYITTNTRFYFSAVDQGTGCESPRIEAQAIIYPIPNAPSTQDMRICGRGEVTLNALPLEGDVYVRYYSSPYDNSPIAVATNPPFTVTTGVVTTTTYYVSSYHPFTGCESPRKALVVLVEPKPARPVAAQVARCGSGKGTFSVILNQPAGDLIRLYADEYTNHVISSVSLPTTHLTTPVATTTTTYFISSVQSATGCESERTPAVLEIHPIPGVPTAQRVQRCGAGIATFTATFTPPFGNVVRVYTSPAAIEPIYADDISPYEIESPFVTTTTTFYITSLASHTGCESEKTPVIVQVNESPIPPLVQDVFRCGKGIVTLTAILPSSHELHIYDQPLANFPVAILDAAPYTYQTPPLEFNTTYYLQSVNTITGCSSDVVPVRAILQPHPQIPIYADGSTCSRGSITLLPLSVPSGVYIRLFDVMNNEIAASNSAPYHLNIEEVATHSTYYVQAVDPLTGCRSERSTVQVRLLNRPTAPVAQNVERCGVGGVTLNVSAPSGTYVKVYSAPPQSSLVYTLQNNEGSVIINDLTQTSVFYLEAIDRATGCSSQRNSVTAAVKPLPRITQVVQSGPTCLSKILTLTAQGPTNAQYVWEGPNNFTAYGPTVTRIIENENYAGTYKVYAIVDGCTSEVASTEVQIFRGIQPVVSYFAGFSQKGPVCEGQDLRLFIDNAIEYPSGTTFIWHGPETIIYTQEPELLIPNAQTINEGYYYVSAIINGCTTQISNEIKILISKYPRTPVVFNTGPYCQGSRGQIQIRALVQEENLRYSWVGPNGFTSAASTIDLPIDINNAGTYQLVVTNTAGCTSQPGATEVVIIPTPPTPIASNSGSVCEGQPITLQAQGVVAQTYLWSGPNSFSLAANSNNYRIEAATLQDAGTYTLAAVVNGCTSAPAFTTVRVIERPQRPTIFSNSPICQGQTLRLTASGSSNATYIWSGVNNFTATSAVVNIPQATLEHNGNYTVTAVANGCESEPAGIMVIVHPIPPAPIVNNNIQVCTGRILSLTASGPIGNTYHWRGPNNFSATGANVSRMISSLLDAGVYTVVAVANGCTSTPATVNVVVNQTPTLPTIVASTVNCTGDVLRLTAVGGGSGVQYRWSGPDNWQASGTTVSRTLTSTLHNGVYSLIAINGNCTSAVASRQISVNLTPPRPTVNTIQRVCEGSTITLTVSFIEGATFEWSGPTGILQTSEVPNLILQGLVPSQSGVYSVVAKQGGCASEAATVTLSVDAAPAAPSALSNSPVCVGSTLILSASGSGNASYYWIGPMNYSASGALVHRVTTSTQESGVYQVYAVANGCTSAVASVEATVVDLPKQPVLSNNSPLCVGQVLSLTAETTPGAQVIWAGPNGYIATGNVVTRVLNSSLDQGIYSATAILGGCTSQIGVTQVVVSETPVLRPITNAPLCAGQVLTLTADYIEGATYLWKGPAAFSSTQRIANRENVTTEYSGVYSVIATIGNCSTPIATVNVTVGMQPSPPGVSTNAPICVGDELKLTALGAPAGAQYVWSGPNGFTSTLPNPVIHNATTIHTGSYSVFAVVNGCSSRVAVVSAVVNSIPQSPVVASNSPICSGERLVLNAAPVQGARYHWAGPNNFSSTQQNPLIPLATSSMAGTYSVVAIVNGCTSLPSTTNVTVNAVPAAPQAKNNSPICAGQSLQLSAFGSTSQYVWSGPNGFSSTTPNPQIVGAEPISSGTYQVVAVVDNCTSQAATTTVTVLPAPKVTASSNGPVCQGEAIYLTANTIAGASYLWQGPLGFSSTLQNPTITPAQVMHSGQYTVVATLNGCTSPAATVNVTVSTPPSLTLVQKTDAGCRRGSIQVSASGGIGNYLYSLDGVNYTNSTGIFTNLVPGNYTVYVKSGECVSSLVVHIGESLQTQITSITLDPHNSASTVNLQWLAVEGALRYNIRYRLAGSNDSWQEVSNITSTSTAVSGLLSNRTYEFEVQAVCNSVHSGPWSSTRNITTGSGRTPSSCTTPANVSAFAVSGTSAIASWEPVSQAVCYVVGVGLLAQSPDLWNYQLIPAPSTSATLNNLQPGTEYGVMVRANCTSCSMRSGSFSEWSNQAFFTTGNFRAEQTLLNSLRIYPNPSRGVFEVSLDALREATVDFMVHDALGRMVLKRSCYVQPGMNQYTIDLANESAGIYILELKVGSFTEVVKLIKQ
ncbi:MAG: fibronectin type III domain-containing protein [Bacteroidia bacterium]|nr:fibronectin type III domain-containing protein [Bacteroidia bacterium]